MLGTIEQRHMTERAYQQALSEWQAATAIPEDHPQWPQFYANALRDALRRANNRRQETLASMTPADWYAAVTREMQAELWYREPDDNSVRPGQAADIPPLRRNGSNAPPKVIAAAASGAV